MYKHIDELNRRFTFITFILRPRYDARAKVFCEYLIGVDSLRIDLELTDQFITFFSVRGKLK